MFYERRRYQVAECSDAPSLAHNLTEHSWTLCQAFRLGDLFFVNDASSEDGAQEYAVIRGYTQVESLTASWMTADKMLQSIRSVQEDRSRKEWHRHVSRFVVDNHQRCHHCM